MRRPILAVAIIAVAGLAGAVPALAQATPEKERSGIDKVGDSASNMAQKPLKDLNIIKPKVSPYLEAIMTKAYATDGLRTCRHYGAEITRLTEILGPDIDSVQARSGKDGDNPAEFALKGAESVVGGLIPGMGIVRMISGADKAQKHATAAVLAGSLRRSYLKGMARAKGCRL